MLHLQHFPCSVLKFFVIGRVSLSRSPLIPLRYGEVLLPWILKRARQRNESNTGSAMNEQENRVVEVLAPDLDPLVNPAYSYRLKAVDAMG